MDLSLGYRMDLTLGYLLLSPSHVYLSVRKISLKSFLAQQISPRHYSLIFFDLTVVEGQVR